MGSCSEGVSLKRSFMGSFKGSFKGLFRFYSLAEVFVGVWGCFQALGFVVSGCLGFRVYSYRVSSGRIRG